MLRFVAEGGMVGAAEGEKGGKLGGEKGLISRYYAKMPSRWSEPRPIGLWVISSFLITLTHRHTSTKLQKHATRSPRNPTPKSRATNRPFPPMRRSFPRIYVFIFIDISCLSSWRHCDHLPSIRRWSSIFVLPRVFSSISSLGCFSSRCRIVLHDVTFEVVKISFGCVIYCFYCAAFLRLRFPFVCVVRFCGRIDAGCADDVELRMVFF